MKVNMKITMIMMKEGGVDLSIAGEAPELSVDVVVFKQAIVLIGPVLAIMPNMIMIQCILVTQKYSNI